MIVVRGKALFHLTSASLVSKDGRMEVGGKCAQSWAPDNEGLWFCLTVTALGSCVGVCVSNCV